MQFSLAGLVLEGFGGFKNLAKERLICGNLESLEDRTKSLEQFIEVEFVEEQFFVSLVRCRDDNDLMAASEAKRSALILPELGAIDFTLFGFGQSGSGHRNPCCTDIAYILYV